MSSSDDDDCYGNIAQRLESMKQTYQPTSLHSNNLDIDNTNVNCLVDDEDDEVSLSMLLENESLKMKMQANEQATSAEPQQPTRQSKRVTRKSLKMKGKNSKPNNTVASTSFQNPQQVSPSRRPVRSPSRRRGAVNGRRRGRGRRSHSSINDEIPVYSIGNTHEYPDASDGVQLFDHQIVPKEIIELADEDVANISFDDNEEISVKVFWKSTEYVKFCIRKFQKITQIFDFFSEKEGIRKDQLFFTLGNRVLKPDDTPDSIDYSICKFIEGGVVHYDVKHLTTQTNGKPTKPSTGLQLKFQCQQRKKPFITNVDTNQKLYLAMVKCAEDFEVPYSKLKFYFDGDLVDSSSTPNQLDLEGGECIDVGILS